jgi:hypothetical protein
MGHANPATTARYMHYKARKGQAARLAHAFEPATADQDPATDDANDDETRLQTAAQPA